MGALDSLIALGILVTFALIIWFKFYNHEKETLDPLFNKVKGWFKKDDNNESFFDPNEDFELSFRGQM